MTSPTLQELIDRTPNGGTLDLGQGTYSVGDDPTEEIPAFVGDNRHGLTITGDGATILARPSSLRHRPAFLVRGTRVTLAGDVGIVGARDTGEPYDPAREAQHGIELQGATSFDSSWHVQHVYGSSYYIGKRVGGPVDRWSERITVHDFTSVEAGRQHIAAQAVDGLTVTRAKLHGCTHAAFDVEPPGTDWGCRHLTWSDTDLYGPFTFAFANLGLGTSTSCSDITLERIRCHGQPFRARIVPQPGTRRQRYAFVDCSSDTQITSPPITAWYVDGLTVTGLAQPRPRGVDPVHANYCTDVTVAA